MGVRRWNLPPKADMKVLLCCYCDIWVVVAAAEAVSVAAIVVAVAAALNAVVHGRTTQLSLGLVLVPSQMHLMTLHWRVRRNALARNRNSRPPGYARCCTPKRTPSRRPLRALPCQAASRTSPRRSTPQQPGGMSAPREYCLTRVVFLPTPMPHHCRLRHRHAPHCKLRYSLLQRVGTLLSSHFCFVMELTLRHLALQHKQQHAALVVARLRRVQLDPGRGCSEMKFQGRGLGLISTLWQWQTARFPFHMFQLATLDWWSK